MTLLEESSVFVNILDASDIGDVLSVWLALKFSISFENISLVLAPQLCRSIKAQEIFEDTLSPSNSA